MQATNPEDQPADSHLPSTPSRSPPGAAARKSDKHKSNTMEATSAAPQPSAKQSSSSVGLSTSDSSTLFREAFRLLFSSYSEQIPEVPALEASAQCLDTNTDDSDTSAEATVTKEVSSASSVNEPPCGGLQQLSLVQPPVKQATPPEQSHSTAFSRYREPSTSDAPSPAKRIRSAAPLVLSPLQGIQPHPAHPPRWSNTPENYTNEFAHLHPWGILVEPRPPINNLTDAILTTEMPMHVYRSIPHDGYFATRFVRSLFPRRFVGTPSPTNKISIMEVTRLPDIIAFRQHAIRLTEELLDYTFASDQETIMRLPRTSPGDSATLLCPPIREGVRPVLYQVVSRSYGQGVILEAKDFFIPGPDLQELQCIPLTQDSVNYLTTTRGFDREQVSVKDFVWVYSLRPTIRALEAEDRHAILRQSRRPRPTIVDSPAPYFFRVHEFILVTPPAKPRTILGLVLSVTRRGRDREKVNNFYAAFEGCHEAIRISPHICGFPITEIDRNMLVLAESRINVSCAMRFSHSPVSAEAQHLLVNAVRRFLPAHPEEAILPLRIRRMPPADSEWITDREENFTNYQRNRRTARRRMCHLFAVASAALAAYNVWADDKATHEVTASILSLDALPIRMFMNIRTANAEGGWTRSRIVHTWVVNSSTLLRTRIAASTFQPNQQTVEVELHSEPHHHRSLLRAIQRYGTVYEEENRAQVALCVRLGRAPSGTDPVYDLLADDMLFDAIRNPDTPTLANAVLDMVYGSRLRPESQPQSSPVAPISTTLGSVNIMLREDQARAVDMGCGSHPILGIQAAFGTGKTVVGALIAARCADKGQLVIATATTNVAVAQFAETLLKLGEFRHLKILRFVADAALREGAPTTSVDLHSVLRGLVANFSDTLREDEIELLNRYAQGRALIERLLMDLDTTLHLTDEEREQFRIAETQNSEATEEAVKTMLRVRLPNIVCLTTASLLSITRPGGLFPTVFSGCHLIIGDEASQIPEPAFVAMVARFSSARHIYIGDINQLEPHVRCSRLSLAARLGGKSVMELLMRKDVPLAPLITTFRAHPALIDLPNELVYQGSLVSGIQSHQRMLLMRRVTLPNPKIPFVFVDVRGRSYVSPTQSHYNEMEVRICEDIVRALLAKDITASSIAVIAFYREQHRCLEASAQRLGIHLHTVDSVQGREVDIVIVLTTRTEVDAATGKFLDDIRRLNVALTRCRHGQFVLGDAEALGSLTNWKRILAWSWENRVLIDASVLPDLFA